MRRIEEENRRIEWLERLADWLGPSLDDEAASALREFVADVGSEGAGGGGEAPKSPDADAALVLRRALRAIGGLGDKERVAIDVISPLVLADHTDEDVGAMLAGEFMGDFGGFLSRELRASDFALGYQSAIAWLERGLPACGLDEATVRRAVECVESKRRYDLDEIRSGQALFSDLSLADRLELVRLGAHAARVLGAGVLDLRSRIPDSLGRAIDRARERLPGGGG